MISGIDSDTVRLSKVISVSISDDTCEFLRLYEKDPADIKYKIA